MMCIKCSMGFLVSYIKGQTVLTEQIALMASMLSEMEGGKNRYMRVEIYRGREMYEMSALPAGRDKERKSLNYNYVCRETTVNKASDTDGGKKQHYCCGLLLGKQKWKDVKTNCTLSERQMTVRLRYAAK